MQASHTSITQSALCVVYFENKRRDSFRLTRAKKGTFTRRDAFMFPNSFRHTISRASGCRHRRRLCMFTCVMFDLSVLTKIIIKKKVVCRLYSAYKIRIFLEKFSRGIVQLFRTIIRYMWVRYIRVKQYRFVLFVYRSLLHCCRLALAVFSKTV